MYDVVEKQNLLRALKRVQANKGCAGIDDMKVEELPTYLKHVWPKICEELINGTHRPQSVKVVNIPKPGGGERMLGIPTVLDRFIQQAIQQILTPLFEEEFSNSSFGFRPGRNAHQAILKAVECQGQGYLYTVDIDLEKFFDNVNHDRLMNKLAQKIEDRMILRLIRPANPGKD